MIKRTLVNQDFKGVILLGNANQQIITQYVDDTSFIIEGEEVTVGNLVRLLNTVNSTSRHEINWNKSTTYWKFL